MMRRFGDVFRLSSLPGAAIAALSAAIWVFLSTGADGRLQTHDFLPLQSKSTCGIVYAALQLHVEFASFLAIIFKIVIMGIFLSKLLILIAKIRSHAKWPSYL